MRLESLEVDKETWGTAVGTLELTRVVLMERSIFAPCFKLFTDM